MNSGTNTGKSAGVVWTNFPHVDSKDTYPMVSLSIRRFCLVSGGAGGGPSESSGKGELQEEPEASMQCREIQCSALYCRKIEYSTVHCTVGHYLGNVGLRTAVQIECRSAVCGIQYITEQYSTGQYSTVQ